MKLLSSIAAMIAMLGIAIAEPILTNDQVAKLREVVLNARENKDYKDAFASSKPAYDKKKQLWVFSYDFPVTPDGQLYVFELREKDGYYRLGWITPWKSSSGYDRFRMASSVKRRVGQLLDDFKQTKKP
jgi:hypothetical protein